MPEPNAQDPMAEPELDRDKLKLDRDEPELDQDEPELDRDELELRIDGLVDDDLNRGMTFFRGRLGATEAAYVHACIRCGLCAEACHYFLATGEPEDVPGFKLGVVAGAARTRTLAGAMFAGLVAVRDFDRGTARAWMDSAYGRCSLCGRCSLRCAVGINIAAILRNARGALGVMGLTPPELKSLVAHSQETGNSLGMSPEAFLDVITRIEQDLRRVTGDPDAAIPVDKGGARVMLQVDPRALAADGSELLATARILHAAREDWTLASHAWDCTNPGHITGSPKEGGAIASSSLKAAQRLGAKVIAIGESGHGFAALRWDAPEWLQKPPACEVVSILHLIADYLREGRICVDGAGIEGPVTLHDPCELARHGGVFQPQRDILGALGVRLVEMPHCREASLCCGGGGGQRVLTRYRDRSLRAGAAKIADIRATAARLVAAPCHDCRDQIAELNREHGLGVEVKGITELVAGALLQR